jgi:hypothetical protein
MLSRYCPNESDSAARKESLRSMVFKILRRSLWTARAGLDAKRILSVWLDNRSVSDQAPLAGRTWGGACNASDGSGCGVA